MHNVQFISVGGSRRDEMQAGRVEDDDDGEEKNGGREEKSEVEERGRRYSIINEREKDRANRERSEEREECDVRAVEDKNILSSRHKL